MAYNQPYHSPYSSSADAYASDSRYPTAAAHPQEPFASEVDLHAAASGSATYPHQHAATGLYGAEEHAGSAWSLDNQDLAAGGYDKRIWIAVAVIVVVGGIAGGIAAWRASSGSSSSSSSGSGKMQYIDGTAKVVKSNPNDPSQFEKDSRLKPIFYGLAYTPKNVLEEYGCGATLANVTEDIQLISQLTTASAPPKANDVKQGPAEYHADFADVLLPLGFRTERNILQVAQAAVLFSCFNLYHGRFSSAYIDTSVAVRICISLGLNHEGYSPRDLPLSSFLSHRTFLMRPRDQEEMLERATTWWFAFTVETFSAAATGWACCIDERDITTLIPAAATYGDDPAARESLYLHSPTFFASNPPHLVRFVQINLKVTVLMNRVCTFIHRTTALANASPDRHALGPADFPRIRASPAFTKLESALEHFGRKAPAQLVTLLEPEAFLCPSLVATSVILLHERFCTSDEGDPGMVKCAEAARNILQNMQVLNSASFHPRQIPPFLTFCWGVAGRTFIRELAILHLRGIYVGDEVALLRSSVQAICARLEQTRTPVGPHMARSILVMLEHPEICLPSPDATARNPPGMTSIARLTTLLDVENGMGAGRGPPLRGAGMQAPVGPRGGG